jgi:hypothetical protein
MIDLTSLLDKDLREQRDASDIAHQAVIRHTGTTKLQCWSQFRPWEEPWGSWRVFNDTRISEIEISLWAKHEVKKGFTVPLRRFPGYEAVRP